jgi:tetratricopeptide (TPR) repeat protein
VFRARRLRDGAAVAIKVARADQATASAKLEEEAEALKKIGAPYVPAVYETGRLPDGSAYVVMEFIGGVTLGDQLAESLGSLPLAFFATVSLALVRLVEEVHRRGLVHCDLKPENVFVDPSFGAKLFDFGLVRQLHATERTVTTEEAPEGTPEYMAPEQCEGRTDLDARADVYALGVMLYEMLAGAPPFWGNPAEVQQSHRSRRPPSLSRRVPVSPELEAIVVRCLAKDRARRFADAGELRQALESVFALDERTPTGEVMVPQVLAQTQSAPAPDAAKARPAAAAAPTRQRRNVGLLFFETRTNMAVLREVLTSVGGQLAHAAGVQCVVVFGHEVGDNPARAAVQAARLFLERGFTKRATVELTSVSIQVKPDGTRRYQTPLFTKKDLYPTEDDPEGVLVTKSAQDVLGDFPIEPSSSRAGFGFLARAGASESTSTRVGQLSPAFGRDELLRSLMESARAATGGGQPTIVTLRAEPGYGKSHLADTFSRLLTAVTPPLDVWVLRAKEALGGSGDLTTRDIFLRAFALPREAPPDLGKELLATKLGADVVREVWAGVAVNMGWAGPDHPQIRALAAAPGALRSATARAAGEALRALARKRPLALILEDAHFADETALDAIEYATLEEARCPLWVMAVGRPAFGRGRTAWASRAAARQELTLEPLEPAAAGDLVRSLLAPAENVPASAVSRLVERTHGIPMLIVELVRGLKRDGLVRRSDKTGSWFLATDELERLPDLPLVQWLSSREMESLPSELLAHARLGALLGTEFSSEELEALLQALERADVPVDTQLDATVGMTRLLEAGILVRHRKGRAGFRHALLRDTVYQSIPPAQREVFHRAAYEHYRGATAMPDEERLPRMALHAAQSGLKKEAAQLYYELAQRAAGRHGYLDAELLYRNALDNLPPEDDRRVCEAARGRGMMRFRLGRHEDSMADLALARERAQKCGDRQAETEILLDQAILYEWTNEWVKSRELTDEAAALARGASTPLIEARIVYGQGRSLHRLEKPQEASELFEKSADMAAHLGDEGYETLVLSLSLLGWEYALIRRLEDSERTLERLIAACEARGDYINLSGALVNRGLVSLMAKKNDRLIADYRRIIALSREGGFPLSECLAVKDLGEVYYLLGHLEEAEPYLKRAIDVNRQIVGDVSRGVINAYGVLARIAAYRGDLVRAREIMGEIRERQRKGREEAVPEAALSGAEDVLLDMVDLVIQGADEGAWDELIGRARAIASFQPQDLVELLEMKGLTLSRQKKPAEALTALQAALKEAETSADLFVDRVRRDIAALDLANAGGLAVA